MLKEDCMGKKDAGKDSVRTKEGTVRERGVKICVGKNVYIGGSGRG